MNNVIFGNSTYGYYETLGGGAGAGPGFSGASGVHTHMTNTRITDPEILEQRFPVRLDRFALRESSGGDGQYRGGDGLVRELTFLEPASISLLSQHRKVEPYGLAGGDPGKRGQQKIVRSTGEVVQLDGIDCCEARPGDRLIVETPGGGGYGKR
jgi:5-oxoprolinase (ATP-hydrolysing)